MEDCRGVLENDTRETTCCGMIYYNDLCSIYTVYEGNKQKGGANKSAKTTCYATNVRVKTPIKTQGFGGK